MTRCSSCGLESPATSRYCGGCGQPLQDRVTRERRQLTVMFCDLVGSTALADRLDPEDLADLILAYQEAVAGAIRKFDGHVAQHLGDGLLVYFGYPVAHEDDPRRAAYAGLRIIESIALLNEGLDAARRLSVRIGIHTGPVVTGELGSGTTQERLALGSTPNVAAKLQGIADPNTVVVSEDTRQLLGRALVTEALAGDKLAALPVSVGAHRLLARATGLLVTPSAEMVGRRGELERVCQAFEAARDGRRAAVLITAEPGLGKTRLVHAARQRIESSAAELWAVQCSPYEQASALSPVAGLVREMFGLEESRLPADSLSDMVAGLDALGLSSADTLPLLASLLSLELEEPIEPLDVSPQKRKELIFEAVATIVARKTRTQPAIWLVEDLHWADPSTVDFLGFLMSHGAPCRCLVLMTARPTFENPWGDSVVAIHLRPLDRADAAALIAQVAAGRTLPSRIVDEIIDRTDGVPLFVEELTKTILESSTQSETADDESGGDFASVSIPTSLQDSLTARLDRLGSAKEVAQLGSVIGREFGIEILKAVAPWSEEALLHGLKQLEAADLVYRQESAPQARYAFKHALVRDAAYEMLLKSARRDYHRRIGAALVDKFPDSVNARPELAAFHFTEAIAPELAIPYWMKAGQNASAESANVEAISHLQRALSCLSELEPSAERDALELAVQLGLGPALVLAKGYAVDEVGQTYLRAQELNERVGDARNRFWIGFAICQFRVIRGEIAFGQQSAQQNLALAEALGDSVFLARAYCLLGVTSCYAGEFDAAAESLDLALARISGHDAEFLTFAGMDLSALTNIYAGWSAWHLGSPDRARMHMQVALASADATGRANARGHALVFGGANISYYLGDTDAVRRYALEAIELGNRHGFPEWVLQGGLWAAWADAATGDAGEKAVAAERSVALLRAYQSSGARLNLSYFMAIVAETQLGCGEMERAAALIDEALAVATETPDPMWEAEVNRMKGELLLRGAGTESDRVSEAVGCFSNAQTIARRQGSKALESRAAASLERVAGTSHTDAALTEKS